MHSMEASEQRDDMIGPGFLKDPFDRSSCGDAVRR